MKLDEKRRCCGRKPLEALSHVGGDLWCKFCARCLRAYDRTTGEQIENWAWKRSGGEFVRRGGKDGKA